MIDPYYFLRRFQPLAQAQGFSVETIGTGSPEPLPILAFLRESSATNGVTIYLSAGIHGDEPSGPLAILKLLEEGKLSPHVNWHIFPMLNPWGLARNLRENADGLDLNRDYRTPAAAQTRSHIDWLKTQNSRYDVCLSLHADCDASGFYLYELNPDNLPSLVPSILGTADKICGIDRSPVIDDTPAKDGVIHLTTDLESRPHWTETAYLLAHHTRLAYTLESPGSHSLKTQTAAHTAATKAAINQLKNNF